MVSYSYKRGGHMGYNLVEYISNYNKENYKSYQLRIKKSDIDLIQKLDSVENRNAYLTKLIRNDVTPSILTIKEIKNRIRPVMEKHQINEVYLFGSYARGEAHPNSDVDIYCSSGDVETLYDEVDLIEELKQALGKEVDVVTIGSQMHEYFRQQLEEDKIRIC